MDKPISIPIHAELGEAPATLPAAAPARGVDPAAFFAALGSPIRWALVQLMADGRELSATEAATALQRDFDGVRKHLQILSSAGVVASRAGADRRVVVYFVPAVNRPEPGLLDYGCCRFFTNV
jgi:hypothetical protein